MNFKYLIGLIIFITISFLSFIFVENTSDLLKQNKQQEFKTYDMTCIVSNDNKELKPLFDDEFYSKYDILFADIYRDIKKEDKISFNFKNVYLNEINYNTFSIDSKVSSENTFEIDNKLFDDYYIINTYYDYLIFNNENTIELNYDKDYFLFNDLIIMNNIEQIISMYVNNDYELEINTASGSLKNTKIIEIKNKNYIEKIKINNKNNNINYYKKYKNIEELKLYVYRDYGNYLFTFLEDENELSYNKYYGITLNDLNKVTSQILKNNGIEIISDLELEESLIEEIKKNIGVEENEEKK